MPDCVATVGGVKEEEEEGKQEGYVRLGALILRTFKPLPIGLSLLYSFEGSPISLQLLRFNH